MNRSTTNKRILAIDILRGLTIAGMITVNNPGSWQHIYAPLRHAQWNGLTPTDLVFPFFMFIMGISTYISLQKFDFKYSVPAGMKILKRSILIFLIGMAIGWFSRFCHYWGSAPADLDFGTNFLNAACSFQTTRIPGVMQRLAICYGVVSLVVLLLKHRYIPYLTAALLVGYFILLLCGNGFAYNETNLLSVVDRAVFGPAHLYKDNGIDPEGLLSTIPSIAHVLLGFCIGRMFTARMKSSAATALPDSGPYSSLLIKLFLIGTILTFAGFLLSYGCPINKKIWSPTYVLTTCGLASSLLALLIWIIDVKGWKRWTKFFEAFGVNPLFMYVLGGVLSILLNNITFGWADTSISIHAFLYQVLFVPLLGETGGSLAYALLFIAMTWSIGYQLYKRNIYIKI